MASGPTVRRMSARESAAARGEAWLGEGVAAREAAVLRRLERLARLLDGRFGIPGTRLRFGLDGLVGLIPGAGDLVMALVALYPVVEAYRLGAPAHVVARMLANVGIDLGVGAVPVVGDLLDFLFKSNSRNVDLLRRHLDERRRRGG